ncbi:D-alanyl-D-alanine carboxypeptidase [Candidatus Uhrbacteria bacterium]|nr:D-alanyl-D-alanine carboxypeptidase [Candidatus Uhrbacteria bacterium]
MITDEQSGRLLVSYNADTPWPLASITKLMTALVVLEHNPGWNKIIRLQKADEVEGARLRVATGTPLTVREALNITLIGSANNTANAIARSTGLTRKQFVARMNAKAKKMGMNNTVFVEPSGIDPANVSTAHDVAILAKAALGNATLQPIFRTKQYRWYNRNTKQHHTIKNTDTLLSASTITVLAGKTGLLDESKANVAMRVSNGKHPLSIVVFGAQTLGNVFSIVEHAAQWTWEAFQWKPQSARAVTTKPAARQKKTPY